VLLFLFCLVWWLVGLVAWQQATRPPSHQGNKPKPNHEQLGHQHSPNPKSKKTKTNKTTQRLKQRLFEGACSLVD
jgi:hypothetical protein